jgi:hypothetical protein
MKSKRTAALRAALVTATSLATIFGTGTAALAHDVMIVQGVGSGGLENNHLRAWVCRDTYSTPVWVTVRYSDGALRRYDGPADAGFCRNHTLGHAPTAIRLCWGSGQNTCTAFKDA